MDAPRRMYLKLLSLGAKVAFNDVLCVHLPDAASIEAAREAIEDWAGCTVQSIIHNEDGTVYIESSY